MSYNNHFSVIIYLELPVGFDTVYYVLGPKTPSALGSCPSQTIALCLLVNGNSIFFFFFGWWIKISQFQETVVLFHLQSILYDFSKPVTLFTFSLVMDCCKKRHVVWKCSMTCKPLQGIFPNTRKNFMFRWIFLVHVSCI